MYVALRSLFRKESARMKRPLVFSMLLLFSAATLHAQAPVGPRDVELDKILPSVIKTPEYAQNGPTKRSKNLDWLEVEVEYNTKPELIDELTFKFSMLIAGKILVSDDITYINILKGRSHVAVAYVAARTLERLNEGKPLTPATIDNIKVDITRQGQLLATKSLKPTALPNLATLSGLVLRKPDTPFAPLFWDRYETLKSLPR